MNGEEQDAHDLKQTTLTQIGWPHEPLLLSSDEAEVSEEEEEPQNENEPEPNSKLSGAVNDLDRAATQSFVAEIERQRPLKDEDGHQELPLQSPGPASSTDTPHIQDPATSAVFKTPPKPLRYEIPSSQSPDTTPILRTASESPSKRERTPLQELPENVWAQRDATPTPTPRKRRGMHESEDANASSEHEKENVLYELKLDKEPQSPSAKASKSIRSTPTSHHRPTTAGSSPGHFTPEGNLRYASTSPSPITTAALPPPSSSTTANARPPFSTYRSHRATRSSQATTVDLTQPTPKQSQLSGRRSSAAHSETGPASSLKAFESQFPYDDFSILASDDADFHGLDLASEGLLELPPPSSSSAFTDGGLV